MQIRLAEAEDAQAIADIILPTIRAGDSYALDRELSEGEALAYWQSPEKETFVAIEDDGTIVGTYYLRSNQTGGGGHVCNCGYMTALSASGKGVARRMCEDSQERARERGFFAMQFNFVVSTNTRAISLWQSLGFGIVGQLPGAFRHPRQGMVDAFIMFKKL